MSRWGIRYFGAPEQLPLAEVLDSLETVLEDPGIRKDRPEHQI